MSNPNQTTSTHFKIWDLAQENVRVLHLTWIAFFITFVMWFSHAPLKPLIMETFSMSIAQWKALLILNVALTIPARIVIGMLVDKFGPRHVFSGLLFASAFICFAFAFSSTYEMLALTRFLCGFIGAGFVIGIRMIGEWFPARQVGIAEGVYGGWGNFGSAAAAMTLPSLALIYGGNEGWRYAVASCGCVSLVYSLIFFLRARNTPKGSSYFKPKQSGGLEVSNKKDFNLYLAMNLPMYIALAVLVWKLSPAGVGLLSDLACFAMYGFLIILALYQFSSIYKVNKNMLSEGVPEMDHYKFKQVAILNWAYFVSFGSELAVVSMLPAFFMETFDLGIATAGLLASGFAFMNLLARPSGGYLSDTFGRKRTMSFLVLGLMIGYFCLAQIDSAWIVLIAVAFCMMCSFFVQATEGAVFAMVPLIKRRMTGQIAGMTGAYGNVGAVCFLTVFSFVDASTFFLVIAGFAALLLVLIQFLEEPEGHISEIDEHGNVLLISVS